MTIRKIVIQFWMPVCIWCTGIFVESSHAIPNIGPDWPYKDKIAHALIYALLSGLICRAFSGWQWWREHRIGLVITGIVLACLYGLSDEWHQSYVIYRTADSADWIADVIGSVTGALGFVRVILPRQRNLGPIPC